MVLVLAACFCPGKANPYYMAYKSQPQRQMRELPGLLTSKDYDFLQEVLVPDSPSSSSSTPSVTMLGQEPQWTPQSFGSASQSQLFNLAMQQYSSTGPVSQPYSQVSPPQMMHYSAPSNLAYSPQLQSQFPAMPQAQVYQQPQPAQPMVSYQPPPTAPPMPQPQANFYQPSAQTPASYQPPPTAPPTAQPLANVYQQPQPVQPPAVSRQPVQIAPPTPQPLQTFTTLPPVGPPSTSTRECRPGKFWSHLIFRLALV